MRTYIFRIVGGLILASSLMYVVGPELGFKATLGIILLIIGILLTEAGNWRKE